MLSEEQVTSYHRDGYLLVPDVFSESELKAYSDAGRAGSETANTSTHVSLIPELKNIWCDSRMGALARALLSSTPVYFGEANYTRYLFGPDGKMTGRHLHHDAKGTPEHLFNRLHSVPPITYPVLRLGIYLQDFRKQSGGIKVSPGSHRVSTHNFADTQFHHVNVPSKPGDVICFTMRLLHSPFGMKLKSDPNRGLAPSEEDSLFNMSPNVFLLAPQEREAIFIDFAAYHELADLHIKSRAIDPKNSKHGVAASLLDDDCRKLAAKTGISLRYDFGIIEVVRKISELVLNQGLDAEALSYLDMLSALCVKHEEWSGYFPIFQHESCDLSKASAIDIYNHMAPQITAHSAALKTRSPDLHMGGRKGL